MKSPIAFCTVLLLSVGTIAIIAYKTGKQEGARMLQRAEGARPRQSIVDDVLGTLSQGGVSNCAVFVCGTFNGWPAIGTVKSNTVSIQVYRPKPEEDGIHLRGFNSRL